MRQVNSRLAALTGTRQVEVTLRADAAADAVTLAVRRLWLQVLALLRQRPTHGEALVRARHLFVALPGEVRQALGASLTGLARWGRLSAVANLRRALPPRLLALAAARRMKGPGYEPGAAGGMWRKPDSPALRSHLPESFSWDDLFAPLRSATYTEPDLLALLFPPPSSAEIAHTVYASGWEDRIRVGTGLGHPDAIAQRLATGLSQGESQDEIARGLLPMVQGVRSSARRVARTEALRVAQASQMQAHAQLGDLVVGHQVHATLDQNTRPEHAARSGTVYYVHPQRGQPGLDEMPNPPQEADGSMAWNCRCYLTPVLSDPGEVKGFEPATTHDPLVYQDWWGQADERRRRIAVGHRRYSHLKAELGQAPEWEHFLDQGGDRLLSHAELQAEDVAQRHERTAKARAQLAHRRRLAGQVSAYGSL